MDFRLKKSWHGHVYLYTHLNGHTVKLYEYSLEVNYSLSTQNSVLCKVIVVIPRRGRYHDGNEIAQC